jgi:hypothetical protein
MRGLVQLVLGDLRVTLSTLFLLFWGVLLALVLARDLRESVGHKLQLLFSSTSTTEGLVVELFEQRGPKGPSNYYVTYRFSLVGADGQNREFTNRERVKRSLFWGLESGSIVTVRYSTRDPSLASISGNEGLCIGTTCLTLFVLLVVLASLFMWRSRS